MDMDFTEADRNTADVRRVLEGDLSAFESIVRRWQGPLVNLAFRFCRDRERAEEMAQEAFLQIYRRLPDFRGESAFSTWVFAVSLNVYRSLLRRREYRAEPIDAIAQLVGGKQPYAELERNESEELIRRAVAGLPDRYRDAVTVFYFKEMNLSETAQMLGVPEGTVKAWLNRGREMLRRKLIGPSTNPPISEDVHS